MLDNKKYIKKKKRGFFGITAITILCILLVIVGIIMIFRVTGKKKLTINIAQEELTDANNSVSVNIIEKNTDEEGYLIYKGDKYILKDNLITILVMGIDREDVITVGGQSWDYKEGSFLNGGQADALFLTIIDRDVKKIYIFAINRNSMTDIDVFNEDGSYAGRYTKQVALQHGYGDGKEESCIMQVKTVSRMLMNVPINGYFAMSMDAVPMLNDAVGGLDVTVLDDIIYPEYQMDLHAGEQVHLDGRMAYWYLRLRNENIFNSSELRFNRQKQYLDLFAAKAKDMALSDIRVITDLYNITNEYSTTNISLDSFTYLATDCLNYEIDTENIISMPGQIVQGNEFEEYYIDEEQLEDIIVRLFYKKAK